MGKPFHSIKGKIRRGEAIERLGLTFYPITVSRYEDFCAVRSALQIRQSTIPVKYMAMDYLSALFAMDMEAKRSDEPCANLFLCAIILFYLSLRMEIDEEEIIRNVFVREENGEIFLDRIAAVQDGKRVEITPLEFSTQIRPLIAAQNGILLPDESDNIDLIKAYEAKKAFYDNGKRMKIDTDDLISTVAYLSGVSEREIDAWTVLEFENRQKAIMRAENFRIYKSAETGGMVKFEKGNPYQSIFFDPLEDELGTRSLEEVGGMLSGAEQKAEI